MRVMIFLGGGGLGHTTRCLALGEELISAGHDVHFGSYGYSKELIEKNEYVVHEIPTDFSVFREDGFIDKEANIVATLKVSNLIKEISSDIVVSDCYLIGINSAKAINLPVYSITNQSYIKDQIVRGPQKILNILKYGLLLHSSTLKIVDRIIIPDYPLPYTVCRKNLNFAPEFQKKLFFSGPLVPQKYITIKEQHTEKPHILSLVGGFGHREPIFQKVLKTANLDPTIHYILISGPSVDLLKYKDIPVNVEIFPFIKETYQYFKSSDVIIAPGGHSTIMEALSFGIPIISFPDVGQREQENNAEVVEEENYGRRLSYDTPPEILLECIREVMKEDRFRVKLEMVQKLGRKLNGPKSIREIMEKDVKNWDSLAKF